MHFCTLGRFYVLVFCVGDYFHDIVEGTVEGGADFDEDINADNRAIAGHFRNTRRTDTCHICEIFFLKISVYKEFEQPFIAYYHIKPLSSQLPNALP